MKKKNAAMRTKLFACLFLLCAGIAIACIIGLAKRGNTKPEDAADVPGTEAAPVSVAAAAEDCAQEFDKKLEAMSGACSSLLGSLTGPTCGDAGYAVFFSVSDGSSRARAFTGTGSTAGEAFQAAAEQAREYVLGGVYPRWLKVDAAVNSFRATQKDLSVMLKGWDEFFRYGIAFDPEFKTALLEAELNGAKILNYDDKEINLKYLNSYLKKADRDKLSELPDTVTLFTCKGIFCDEDGTVYELSEDSLSYGRRLVDTIDADYALGLVENGAEFLLRQLNDDGSFVYGMYPRFDKEIDNYNFVRHASTIWSLVCEYRITGDAEVLASAERAIQYMIDNAIVYRDAGTAYLTEPKDSEIKLGGCGCAVLALTEYMDATGSDRYLELATALGKGILSMLDLRSGTYVHVLNMDYTVKEEMRTVYYDGEATFALCRLFGKTTDPEWLTAAIMAVNHFISADYTQYKDHWIAYAMNEITKYVPKEEYYAFALKNAQVNLEAIYDRVTTYHTYLELLMVTFETYDRMLTDGVQCAYLDEFDVNMFLKTIYRRADRMLNGFFFPEYAMYMQNPERVLNTFMVRHDGYRIRIDDVQHNIGGYYLYYKNYDKLVSYGLLTARDAA